MKKVITKKEVTEYIEKCSYCGKEIKGTSESQVLYNLSVHINQKHKKNERRKSRI